MAVLLRHLDVRALIRAAGGNPWELNRTVQAGAPGELSDLASAFRQASSCTQETTDEFLAAKARFEAAWDRQDGGDHPINDSQEVRRFTESLNYNRDKMAKVAVDLQNISASLAEAQRSGAISIGNLEASLHAIDNQIDHVMSIAAANGETVDVSEFEQAAVDRTASALREVHAIRAAYTGQLEQSRSEMIAEGYTPDAMADNVGHSTAESRNSNVADKYDAGSRAADQALVDSPGPSSPEKRSAAGRLRDFATIRDATADADAIRYAEERLEDTQTTTSSGPFPLDPVLGGDARTRAQARLDWQQKLEQGHMGSPSMTPDQATEWLNRSEATARDFAIERLRVNCSAPGCLRRAPPRRPRLWPRELCRRNWFS